MNLRRPDAAEVLRRGVLSPLLLPSEEGAAPDGGRGDGEERALPLSTAVEQRADALRSRADDIRALLRAFPDPAKGVPVAAVAHAREAVRQASFVCARLESCGDDALPLFEAIAGFQHTEDILHPEFLRVLPVELLSESVRLTLCARYLSVWRRYVRGLCDGARIADSNASADISSKKMGTEIAAKIGPKAEDRTVKSLYLDCPRLHLVALHEMQRQYVMSGAPEFVYAMTCVRERLEACLSIRPGRMSGRQDFLLAPYLPSGNLMAPVWTALTKVDTREDPGGVAASAVQALNALLRDHPTESEERSKVRGAMWLHLQQYVKFQARCHGAVKRRRASDKLEGVSAMLSFLHFALCPSEHQESALSEEALLACFRCAD